MIKNSVYRFNAKINLINSNKIIFRSLILFTLGLSTKKNQMRFLPRLNPVLTGMQKNAVIITSF